MVLDDIREIWNEMYTIKMKMGLTAEAIEN